MRSGTQKATRSRYAQAPWIKKAGKLHYGYKKHLLTNDNGLAKTHSQHILESIAYNLKRLPRLWVDQQCKQLILAG